MESKSAIIIGAGVAGLSAGVYAQMNGYKTRIFEMHDKPGGLCTAWDRKGYTIDGCLHWLVGSAPGNGLYPMWTELGMLRDKKVIDMEQFYRYEAKDGRCFTVYCNIDRLEKHMKDLSPEDAPYITELCAVMRRVSRMEMPMDKAAELYNLWDTIKMVTGMLPYMGAMRKWGGKTVQDLVNGFKSQLLRDGFQFWPEGFSAVGFMVTVAWMHNKIAGYIIGGSLPLMRSVEERYKQLGGSINYKARVAKIIVENDRAVGVKLTNGEEHRADYVISAADGRTTIFDMLGGKYIDEKVKGYYDNLPIYAPVAYVGLGINRTFDDVPQMVSGLTIQLDKPVTMAGREQSILHVRIYNFDDTMAAVGKTVVTSMIESDHEYWKELKKDPARYKAEKDKVAKWVIGVLEKRFPGLAGQVEMIDVATPVTFERYTGNWQGCYQGFLTTPKTLMLRIKKTLPGLDGLYMVGQWVSPGGGLPSGVMTGRHVVQMICNRDGKRFATSVPASRVQNKEKVAVAA